MARYKAVAFRRDGSRTPCFARGEYENDRFRTTIRRMHSYMHDKYYRTYIWHWHIIDTTTNTVVAWHTKGRGGHSFAYDIDECERYGWEWHGHIFDLRNPREYL